MLSCQLDYVSFLKAGRTASMTETARKTDKQSHARLNTLRAKPENGCCFDCTALKPGWAVLPHGIFVCIDCAQTHRHLGRHISQTKAVNTGTYLWFPAEIAVMEQVGNGVAQRAFAHCNLPVKPSRDATPEQRLAYAKLKYGVGQGVATPEWGRATELAALPPPVPICTPAQPATQQIPAAISGPNSAVKRAAKAPAMRGATRVIAPMPLPTPPARPVSPEPDLISFDEPMKPGADGCLPDAAPADAAFFAQFGL